MHAGWFREYTRSGKRVQKEGKPLRCQVYAVLFWDASLTHWHRTYAGVCSCYDHTLAVVAADIMLPSATQLRRRQSEILWDWDSQLEAGASHQTIAWSAAWVCSAAG